MAACVWLLALAALAPVLPPALPYKAESFRLIFQWNTVDYDFGSRQARSAAIRSRAYIPNNVFVMGLDIWRNKLLVSTPRMRDGVWSAMNYIDLADQRNNNARGPTSPLLKPYPNIEENTLPDLGDQSTVRIISAYRFRVDVCDRLWLMDQGAANGVVYTNPQVLVYDLTQDTLITRHVLQPPALQDVSFFVSITVDVTADKCGEAFAYMADVDGYALVVYDFKRGKSWKIKHNFFYLNPIFGEYNVGGSQIQWSDGIFGLSLGAPKTDGTRSVFFHSLSSNYQFVVSNSVLRNESQGIQSSYYDYHYCGEKGPNSQTTSDDIHAPTGIMFFTQVNKNAVYCWNTNGPLSEKTISEVASGDDMVFPADLKVVGDHVWFLTNRFPTVALNKIDPNLVNYRIYAGPAGPATKHTVCDQAPAKPNRRPYVKLPTSHTFT